MLCRSGPSTYKHTHTHTQTVPPSLCLASSPPPRVTLPPLSWASSGQLGMSSSKLGGAPPLEGWSVSPYTVNTVTVPAYTMPLETAGSGALSGCLSVCLYVRMFVCLSACLSVCLPVFLCQSVYLSACLPACLSVYLPACLSTWLPVCLSTCLPVYLAACLSVYLPACLSTCLPGCLSVCVCRSCQVFEKHFRFMGLSPLMSHPAVTPPAPCG